MEDSHARDGHADSLKHVEDVQDDDLDEYEDGRYGSESGHGNFSDAQDYGNDD